MFIVKRCNENPLLSPVADRTWEARGSFNGSPFKQGSLTHLLYRAQGLPDALMVPGGLSTVAAALSFDGIHFQNHRQLITPVEPWEKYGCEDPRVTFFEGKYIIFYTALGGIPFGPGNIKVACAISSDLETIEERHLVTPFNAKAFALFPERVNGKITGIFTAHTDEPPAKIAIVQCDRLEQLWDLAFWESWYAEFDSHVIDPRRFDDDHAEVGAVPIKTKEGWLLIYSHVQKYFSDEKIFGIEALLLDNNDPHLICGRTKGPIMVPQEIYEKFGSVPNIVFPSGALREGNKIDIYYGAADTVTAKASLDLTDFLSAIIPERRTEIAERSKNNPLLLPLPEHDWESVAVFNAAVFDLDGEMQILYRAMGHDNTSVVGLATSKTGAKINERLEKPIYVPRSDFEAKLGGANTNSGCEDPRVVVIDNRIYMTYTAYNGARDPQVALTSISLDDYRARKWDKWTMPVLVSPDNANDKDASLFPEKVAGQYMILHRIGGLVCADLIDSLEFSQKRLTRCIEIMGPRPGCWDSRKVGIAGPPIKTKKGWLLIYHGISKTSTYRLGAALLDLKNPAVVLARTVDTIFEPVEEFEKVGLIPNVVFSCGQVVRGDTLHLFYGGADTSLGVAKLSIKQLLAVLAPESLEEKE